MLEGNNDDRNPPMTVEERYAAAVSTSDLTVHEHRRGAAHLLVASGLSAKDDADASKARPVDKPSLALGGALARLQSEWHSVEKPQRRMPRSIRQWIEALPLVKTGERIVHGKPVAIMARDKEGARVQHNAERERLDALYSQELKFLAQKLPSRYWVRERLFVIAVLWKLEEPSRLVAEVMEHWLDDTCHTCHGTGEVMSGEKVVTCTVCEGVKKAPIPGGMEGRRLFVLMEESKHAWAQSVSAVSRRLHTQVDR